MMIARYVDVSEDDAVEIPVADAASLPQSLPPKHVLVPTAPTGFEVFQLIAAARRALGPSVPIRARWDGVLDVKAAALALSYGADELAGPLAPPEQRRRLAQLGGPPEDVTRPSPRYVEELIRAAGREPVRGRS